MKKIIFSVCIILIGINTFAKSVSESKVPIVVKAAFFNAYPKAENIKWELTKENDYKANFRLGENYSSAFYTDQGEFIESDITIDWKDVPLTGRMEIYHSGKGEIMNSLKIVNKKKEIFYQVDMKKDHKVYEIMLDNEGNILK